MYFNFFLIREVLNKPSLINSVILKRGFTILVFLVSCASNLQSQDIKLKILDVENSAIQNIKASISRNGKILKEVYLQTDSLGFSLLPISELTYSDSIQFFHIAYKTKFYTIGELSKELYFYPKEFKEVVISRTRKKLNGKFFGIKKPLIPFFSFGDFEEERLVFFKYSKSGKISKVRLHIIGCSSKKGLPKPVMLKLFSATTEKNVGVPLLPDSLIVIPEKVTGSWLEVDITAYNISVPENGFYLGYKTMSKDWYKVNNYFRTGASTHGKYNSYNIAGCSMNTRSDEIFFKSLIRIKRRDTVYERVAENGNFVFQVLIE